MVITNAVARDDSKEVLVFRSWSATMSEKDGDGNRSPWTRSCERKRHEAVFGAKSNKLGVNMQGRVLFKQLKTNQQDARQPVSKTAAGPSRTAPTRINFRSNIAGIVKLVTTTPLRAGHFEQLKRTPFWIMVEAIRINKLNHKEFRKYDDAILKIIRTYDARGDAFNIGGNSVKMSKSDIRLLFGIQCGTKHIDLSPCQRPTSDFIQRRSQNTVRITSKLVKSLFEEAVAGRRRVDEEDAAKLLTLYMCGKMFFANSGETISWAFVRYIDDLKTVRLYDWTGAILQMLMGSIKDFHQTPEKVTGCVVALLYWICEHSTLVKPETESMFPRFMRWDIGTLVTRIRGLDLSAPDKFEVRIERMKSLEYEREILATDEQEVHRRDDGVNDVVIGAGEGMQRVTHQVVDAVGVKGKDGGSVVRDAVSDVDGATELENALKCMADLELKNKAYEGTISKLEDEVVSLKSKMEMQAVNIVGGFGCVVKVKDDEIRKLENENKELRQTISLLEDQLADQQVHTVTQAYRMNTPTGCRDVGASHCDVSSGFGVTVVHDVTPIRVGLNVDVSGDNVTVHTVSDSSPVPDRSVADVNVTDLEVGVFSKEGEGIRNSFVRNLKNKARKELRLKDYEYQVVGEREKKTVSYGCKDVGVGKATVTDAVVDVDTVGVAASKWSGFDLNNRFGVWKMMTYEEKEKIMKAYERNGDGAVMWDSSETGVAVYFTDVKSLVRGESICGNVIDAYAETLVTEQTNVCADDVLADKSYFFSSICMSVFKSGNNQAMESYVLKNFGESKDCRYIHFPICNNAHWTLVVYDAEDGSWKHFNPMRQRSAGRSDVHYNEALLLKERVSVVMKRSLRADGIDEVSIAETFNHPLEAVEDCPQQKPDSLDCAVIVCAVMRQYVHHVDVARSLQGTNGIVLRANMVKGFVNDISRGLKHSN